MFIWQYINIDPTEVSRIQKSFMKAMPNNFNFFQPLTIDTDELMGMKIKQSVLIQLAPAPFNVGKIHTDVRHDNNVLAIQIPLINCENSITEFWEADQLAVATPSDSNGSTYQYFSKDQCKKIDQFQLINPLIFRTDIPHSVTNKSKSFRKAISLRFYTDPWHLVNI